ncbi:hypothetical protein MNEG_6927 [Monoraphidium neglectum]|jgi:fatty acid desaturase (delta-4 desaturase)|uniref:Proteasome assembly chaperone 1 n=1 Tax=Monoraphidium neglectum TaxID=145388 RepID=A0A0D2JPG7_9CHLO|nr:hypothetical protein MNEG_6927 [Monoraphidium neglectum]KIZ01033.1 hypothetical protein MNEG_6927 [Monoraphidium neglectum]|eukprot:XP_013900052.1 hypothetical protein MNEG_6927 [Monoraphidium neglectum]
MHARTHAVVYYFRTKQEVGSIPPSAPDGGGAAPGADLDVIYGGSASSRPRHRASAVLAPTGAPGAALAVCCREDVPAERAGAWARALLRAVAPAAVVILGAVRPEHYRGAGDASQEFLSFTLQTTARRQQQGPAALAQRAAAPPPLPSGSIVAGLPAALLTACELRGLAGVLLVSVEQVPALLPDSLPHLAGAAAALLSEAPAAAAPALAGALRDAGRVAAARAGVEHWLGRARGAGSVYV